jgi:hypothetical protein
MIRKDILELKRRFKKDECTFTKLCGCYVNGEKKILLTFKENFLNLPDEEFYKYLEIAKKILSGKIGNNLLELTFPLSEDLTSEKQSFLKTVKESQLKQDDLLHQLYQNIIDSYDIAGNYLILLFHDVYDVMTRTSDNIQLDESEEIYEYIMCGICPVTLAKPALSYFDQDKSIKPRIRDWIVGAPVLGFTYPAFIERSSDVNALMYYTKNAKDSHPELMTQGLGCAIKKTATVQKETFQSIIEKSISADEQMSKAVYTKIQDNLNTMVEEYNEMYEDTDKAPIALTKYKVKELLKDSELSEEVTTKIEASFEEVFEDDTPLAENLIDTKVVKANEQKKKEEQLVKQVQQLESKLSEVSAQMDTKSVEEDTEENLEMDLEGEPEESTRANADVVLHVNPIKLQEIKTQMIDGRKCIIVPINDNEQATINGGIIE